MESKSNPAFLRVLRFLLKGIMSALLLASSVAALGGDFEEANDLFEKGNFEAARSVYQKLVQRGPWSANLFCNLGDAEFRLNEPGRAILAYERALALEPAHPEAAHNLKVVRDRAGSHVAAAPLLAPIFPKLPASIFAIAAAAAGWLAIFILARFFVNRAAGGALALAFCIGVALYCGAALWEHLSDGSLAVITRTSQVEARLAPADRAALAEMLPAGSRVYILSERGEWTYCKLPGNGLGWIPTSALEKVRLLHS